MIGIRRRRRSWVDDTVLWTYGEDGKCFIKLQRARTGEHMEIDLTPDEMRDSAKAMLRLAEYVEEHPS